MFMLAQFLSCDILIQHYKVYFVCSREQMIRKILLGRREGKSLLTSQSNSARGCRQTNQLKKLYYDGYAQTDVKRWLSVETCVYTNDILSLHFINQIEKKKNALITSFKRSTQKKEKEKKNPTHNGNLYKIN